MEPLKARNKDITDVHSKADAPAKYFSSVHSVDRSDPVALALVKLSQFTDNLLTTVNLGRQMENSNNYRPAGPDYIHLDIAKPLARIIAGPMSHLLKARIE